jgi:hypothetical protein
MSTDAAPTTPVPEAKVTTLGDGAASGWSLVEYGSWSVSVGPDGLIHFPRHITASEVPDFVQAIRAAAEVAGTIKADNEAAGAKDDRSRPRRTIVRAGPPPDGAARMPAKPHPTGSIGRRGRKAANPPPRGSAGFPAANPSRKPLRRTPNE